MRILLLLTSAVNISNASNMIQKSSVIRATESFNALKKWGRHTNIVDILVCDNTDYTHICNDKISKIKFYGQNFNQELGKGYGEYITLKYIIDNHSELDKYDFIAKCNCRYYINNFEKIINKIDMQHGMYVDLHCNLTWADSRFFIMNRKLFISLVNNLKSVNDSKSIYFEHILSKFVLSKIMLNETWSYIPCTPFYIGTSGTTGKKYSYIKFLTKSLLYFIARYVIKK